MSEAQWIPDESRLSLSDDLELVIQNGRSEGQYYLTVQIKIEADDHAEACEKAVPQAIACLAKLVEELRTINTNRNGDPDALPAPA